MRLGRSFSKQSDRVTRALVTSQGEAFSDEQTIEIFFKVIKAFQHEDPSLKKLLAIYLRHLQEKETLYMVTNSVTKDITSSPSFNAKVNALRMLPMFVSAQNPVQIERMLKDNLIDKNPEVVESALMALYEIQKSGNQELVKKCSVELESLLKNHDLSNITYIALNVLLNVRFTENIVFLKNFSNFLKHITKGNGKVMQDMSSFSLLQVLKACTSLVLSPEALDRNLMESMLLFLELALDRKSDMVKIECTRMLSFMENVDNSSMKPFVRELRELLEWNDDPITHYETLKVLEFIIRNPYRLSLFSGQSIFDNLLNSESKMVVSLVITILIKIVNEASIERLLDKIFKIMNDVPDTIKERVVTNCLLVLEKFPTKLLMVVKFLNNCLREKGELSFKLTVIGILEQILVKYESVTENVLDFLSEYIEDSMHASLTVRILVIISRFNCKLSNKGSLTRQVHQVPHQPHQSRQVGSPRCVRFHSGHHRPPGAFVSLAYFEHFDSFPGRQGRRRSAPQVDLLYSSARGDPLARGTPNFGRFCFGGGPLGRANCTTR